MPHVHSHGHQHTLIQYTESGKNITIAFWLNTIFAIIELVGGFMTNSVAILSDALHDFGDSLSLGLAYYFHKKSAHTRDKVFSYGYKRFSLLGAFVNSLVLIIGSVFILQEAISRIIHPEVANARGMLMLALLGIAVNGIAMLRLKKGHSINERVVSLHFLEDVLGWIAVLVGSLVMMWIEVPILDPLLSLLMAGYILFNVYKNLREAFRIILQGIPEDLNLESIQAAIKALQGVSDIHDVHTWSMDGHYNIMTLHLVVHPELTAQETEDIKQNVRHLLQHNKIHHVTVETENDDENCELKEC